MSSPLQNNITNLQSILDIVNALPEAGTDLPELSNPADDSKVLSGYEFINENGEKATGTIATKTASNLTASGATVTVPAGYYASQATKSVATVARADTTITTTADDTNDKLTITASNNQGTGYVTGANKTASTTISLTANGATVTASDGTNSVSKSVATATQATPSVSIDSAGKITATATQTAGYVAAGTKSGTKQLTTQAAKTITPSTSSQTAVAKNVYTTGAVTVAAIPSTYVKPTTTKAATTYTPTTSNQTIAAGTYCSGAQTIKGDANLKAENIAEGVSIFGVTGTHSGGTTLPTLTKPATATEVLSGYEFVNQNGSKVTGSVESYAGSYECSGDSTGGGSGGVNLGTCTFEIIDMTGEYPWYIDYVTLENGNMTAKSLSFIDVLNGSPASVNVVPGSILTLYSDTMYGDGAMSTTNCRIVRYLEAACCGIVIGASVVVDADATEAFLLIA